jgi:Rrf2 family iron-sulfur cluster assembly transcriptional regulator
VRSGVQREGVLNTQDLWDSLNTAIFEHMKTITLKSLAEDQKSKGFKVEERKPAKKAVLQKIKPPSPLPRVPNSVFALGQVWSRS